MAALSACGGSDSGTGATEAAGGTASPPAAVSASPVLSSAPSPAPASGTPHASVGPGGEDAEEGERVARERAAAAASGIPVSGKPYDPDEPDFTDPVVSQQDITVYRATRQGDGLTVPVTITNNGDDRAAYSADIRVTGPGGFDAVLHVSTDGRPLFAHTSMPTELTATDPGKPVPADPVVTIEHVSRKPFDY